jgi:1-acyl-sn-glycerol-3-phosphate acyltransferase
MIRYRFMRVVMRIIQLILASLTVYGRENIPEKGPYIVATNHMSTVDTPVLLISFPLQKWRFFAGEKWQNHPVFGPLMGWLGAIYINRGEVDRSALREALEAIEAGSVFGLAPEGFRSKIGELTPARDGAAYLASRSDVPILPVGIANTNVLFANAKKLRRTRLEVHIGEPFVLPDLGRRVRSRDLPVYTELIMAHIAAQLPERYHGAYADSPALHALLAGEDPWPACQAMPAAPRQAQNG